jgi:uncharacterized repeat protein (TIGR01451 family)
MRPRLCFCIATVALAAAIDGAVLIAATSAAEEAGATALGPADLSLTKSDSHDPVPGGVVTSYEIGVQNAGPDAATNVTVSDDLPRRVDPVATEIPIGYTGECNIQGRKVSCRFGTIESGGAAWAWIYFIPKKAGQIINTASVESDVADPQTANNQDSESTTISRDPPTCHNEPFDAWLGGDNDVYYGAPGRDVALLGGGNDRMTAGGGRDVICAGPGNDLVAAGDGRDFAKGQAGHDKLNGQANADTLRGDRGRDTLKGGRGNDLLAGGKGRDSCKGGSGEDILRSC